MKWSLGDLVATLASIVAHEFTPGVAENLDRPARLAMQKNLAGKGVAFTVLQKLGLDVQTVRREVEKEASAKQTRRATGSFFTLRASKKCWRSLSNTPECLNHSLSPRKIFFWPCCAKAMDRRSGLKT